MSGSIITTDSSPLSASGRRLLLAGSLAGPLFVLVVITQEVFRAGFDPRIHALSMLSLGEGGWLQTLNFLVAGVLALCGAAGLRAALGSGIGRRWGPRLIALYGIGLIWGGLFATDPALGFPAGATAPPSPSWHATLHNLSPTLMGLSLIAACIVFARRYASQRRLGLMIVTILAPIAYLGLGFAAFPLADFRLLLAGGSLIWLWPSVVMLGELAAASAGRPATAEGALRGQGGNPLPTPR